MRRSLPPQDRLLLLQQLHQGLQANRLRHVRLRPALRRIRRTHFIRHPSNRCSNDLRQPLPARLLRSKGSLANALEFLRSALECLRDQRAPRQPANGLRFDRASRCRIAPARHKACAQGQLPDSSVPVDSRIPAGRNLDIRSAQDKADRGKVRADLVREGRVLADHAQEGRAASLEFQRQSRASRSMRANRPPLADVR